ncbi:MAG: AAA family ATPase [Spirochaetes bacterium]|nr:MAG: AAA family ATPase [Spirochaetota bacterium]
MKREADHYLEEWIRLKRRKPLIIRGARQVGKSTLVRNFAREKGFDLFEVNLELFPDLTAFNSMNIDNILRDLEVLIQQQISSKTLIFIDEIQKYPIAITALRYFYEKRPEIPVIAAGSLLEVVLEDMEYSMPVGRIEYLYLGPMTFFEFLSALKEETLLESCRSKNIVEISPDMFNRLVERYREFLFIGGMPEAVLTYAETKSGLAVERIHRSIVETYIEDFAKYKKRVNTVHLEMVFNYISTHVGQKIKYSNISRDHQSRELKKAFNLLVKAGVILPVYYSSCSGIPLKAGIDTRVVKPYFLDVGLMNHQYGLSWNDFSSLQSQQLFNIGVASEQFAAQHLIYGIGQGRKPELYYWIREKKSTNAEVDFVVTGAGRIWPIEIKSGKSGTLKSLHQFLFQKKLGKAVRFNLDKSSSVIVDTSVKNGELIDHISFKLFSFPIFFIENFYDYLNFL